MADLGTRLQAAFSSALKAALHSGFRRDFQSGRALLEAEFVASNHSFVKVQRFFFEKGALREEKTRNDLSMFAKLFHK